MQHGDTENKVDLIESAVEESIASLEATKREFGDKWTLTDHRSCEMWLKGYFTHQQNKKGFNAALELLEQKNWTAE